MISRLILDALVLFAVFHGWWFIALPIVLICLLRYELHFETLVAGLAYDSLFGLVPGEGLQSYIGILFAATLFSVMIFLKKILRK